MKKLISRLKLWITTTVRNKAIQCALSQWYVALFFVSLIVCTQAEGIRNGVSVVAGLLALVLFGWWALVVFQFVTPVNKKQS